MKIDAYVKITLANSIDIPQNGLECTVPIDEDYISDFDDVIQAVDDELFEKFNEPLHYMVNYEITNAMDICSDLLGQ